MLTTPADIVGRLALQALELALHGARIADIVLRQAGLVGGEPGGLAEAAGAQQRRLVVHDVDEGTQSAFGEGDEVAGRKLVEGGETLGG